jgi:hypothetical protein
MKLSDAAFRTLGVIHGLAWPNKGECTPALTVNDLAALRHLKDRQIYNHLEVLKRGSRIRIESLGHNLMIIYPLRGEPTDAALPADDTSSPAGFTGDNRSTVDFTAKNCSNSATNGQHVDSDIPDSVQYQEVSQQHDQYGSAKNCSDTIEAMMAIFTRDGATPDQASKSARALIDRFGIDQCRRQLAHFPRRCELARASENGLRNASGLLVRSIKGDWSAPPQPEKQPGERTWYTDEESKLILR